MLNIDHQELYKDIRLFLLGLFPDADRQVVQAIQNNQPIPDNAIVMAMLFDTNLGYSVTHYDKEKEEAYAQNSVEQRLQLDFYGPTAEKRSRIVENLWRNYYGCDNLKLCQPLYVQSRHRIPFINESNNYEDRFVLDLALQYNPEVTHHQDFIDDAEISITPVT